MAVINFILAQHEVTISCWSEQIFYLQKKVEKRTIYKKIITAHDLSMKPQNYHFEKFPGSSIKLSSLN